MSFGEGNLHDEVTRLSESNDKLMNVNGLLCAEVNRQERRIRELESSLNYVADRWAEAQISAEDFAKRCRLLESLVRDMLPWVWESGIGAEEYDSITERAAVLGIGEGR